MTPIIWFTSKKHKTHLSCVLLPVLHIFKLLLFFFICALVEFYQNSCATCNTLCTHPNDLLSLNLLNKASLFVHSIFAPGIKVDDLIMQLVGLRYTEPDMTISYPGFLYLLMKLESMIRKGGGCGGKKTDGTLSKPS